eukprot:306157-Alexandrium_andersonii.AAC.1
MPELPILRQEPEMFDLSTPPVPLPASADGGGPEEIVHGAERGMAMPVADLWMSGETSVGDISLPPVGVSSDLE